MNARFNCCFDFDSTLCAFESFDKLLCHTLNRQGQSVAAARQAIEAITDRGMNGQADLSTTIRERLAFAGPSRADLVTVAAQMADNLTPGMIELTRRLRENGNRVFVLSGGFVEIIAPAARRLGIPVEQVYANRFVFVGDRIEDFHLRDGERMPDVKSHWLHQLNGNPVFADRAIMIGDGMTDAATAGTAEHFIGFGLHRDRPAVRARSQRFCVNMAGLERHLTQCGALPTTT